MEDLNGYRGQWAKLKKKERCSEDCIYKIYGKMLYIFSDENTLITVEHLPGKTRMMRAARGEKTVFETDYKRRASLEEKQLAQKSVFAA